MNKYFLHRLNNNKKVLKPLQSINNLCFALCDHLYCDTTQILARDLLNVSRIKWRREMKHQAIKASLLHFCRGET